MHGGKVQKTLRYFLAVFLLLAANISFGQTAVWQYEGKITYASEDSNYAQPYLCEVDAQGRLYVMSSKVTSLNARNMIHYADPGDTEFTKLVDYFENGEEDSLSGRVGQLLGITTIVNDVVVSARIPNQQVPGGASSVFYYTDGDTNQTDVFGFNIQGAGWGTPVSGITANKDSIVIGGIVYQGPSFRNYNFSTSIQGAGYGSWFTMSSQPLEPNGVHTNGFDVIRDIAVQPDGDYFNTETPFFTSRNALSSTSLNGGIALWTGGSINDPASYSGGKIQDQAGLLELDAAIPYGITVDHNNILWVAGIDSLRRWVKGFDLSLGLFATVADELPSQNSFDNPNPTGAPMISPSDVAFSDDGVYAYVIDAVSNCAYKFTDIAVGVDDKENVVYDFSLNQNYPNPFNPSTLISFTIPDQSNVKLIVTNSLGQIIATLIDGNLAAGEHRAIFDGNGLSSGVYYYTLSIGSKRITNKMMLMK